MNIGPIGFSLMVGLLSAFSTCTETVNPYQQEREEMRRNLKCILGLTKSYIVTDYSGTLTEPIEADSTITNRCPMIRYSCCSPSEITSLFNEAYNRLSEISQYFAAIRTEFRYFEEMDAQKIEDIFLQNSNLATQDSECRIQSIKPVNPKTHFGPEEMMRQYKKLSRLFSDLVKMYAGSNCFICDAEDHANIDLRETADEWMVEVKVTIRICPALFKINLLQVQLIQFLLKFAKMTEFMRCNGSVKAREAYQLLNPFVEHLIAKFTLLQRCRHEADDKISIVASKECQDLCRSFLVIREWVDQFNIITLARGIHQIYEEYFQDQASSEQPIRNYDKYNEILIKNIVDWKHFYRFPVMYPKKNTEFTSKSLPILFVNIGGLNPFDHQSKLTTSLTTGEIVKEY